MRYQAKVEPYKSRLIDMNVLIKTTSSGLNVPGDFMYYLAKSSGLKSNKFRLIKKRFKKILVQAVEDYIDESRK